MCVRAKCSGPGNRASKAHSERGLGWDGMGEVAAPSRAWCACLLCASTAARRAHAALPRCITVRCVGLGAANFPRADAGLAKPTQHTHPVLCGKLDPVIHSHSVFLSDFSIQWVT